jgi:hypothetical protein
VVDYSGIILTSLAPTDDYQRPTTSTGDLRPTGCSFLHLLDDLGMPPIEKDDFDGAGEVSIDLPGPVSSRRSQNLQEVTIRNFGSG